MKYGIITTNRLGERHHVVGHPNNPYVFVFLRDPILGLVITMIYPVILWKTNQGSQVEWHSILQKQSYEQICPVKFGGTMFQKFWTVALCEQNETFRGFTTVVKPLLYRENREILNLRWAPLKKKVELCSLPSLTWDSLQDILSWLVVQISLNMLCMFFV